MMDSKAPTSLENYGIEDRLPSWPKLARQLFIPALVSVISVGMAQIHYLVFHTVAEIFSIVIALTALVVATTSLSFTRNHFTVYVAVALGWCAGIDLLHVLAFPGMNLLMPDDVDLASQLWVAARFIQASALLLAPFFLQRSVRLGYLHGAFAFLSVGSVGWIFSGYFPETFSPGEGQTAFKIYAEYLIIAILGAAAFLLRQRRQQMSGGLYYSMFVALLLMLVSEFAFTQYISVYGLANQVGHVLKIFAFWFVYLALVQSTLREPFGMLSRTASTYDAVPEPAFVISRDGLIRQANQAAASYAGLPMEVLVGRHVHALFHAPAVAVTDCPACAALAGGQTRFSMEVERGEGLGTVECTVAPFMEEKAAPNFVQVVRDITERKRLLADREALVSVLSERVKELRCQYAVTEILDQADIDESTALLQVLEALPPGFHFPDHARAAFIGELGVLGATGSEQARHVLETEVLVGRKSIGQLRVFYTPDMPQEAVDPFLSEERQLMRTIALRVGQAFERRRANRQVIRLSSLYDMLSATNRAIVRCSNEEELLARLFDALILHSTFPMLYIAVANAGALPLRLVHTHGIRPEQIDHLRAAIADRESHFAPLFERCRNGQVVWEALPREGRHVEWLRYLAEADIVERAVLPLMREGRLVGVAVLFANRAGAFDDSQIKLLDEMSDDLEFALDSLAQQEKRQAAEKRADLSENRFRELFHASPTPMQIMSVSQRVFVAINRAHQEWLGYSSAELVTEKDWFQSVYADAQIRQELELLWAKTVATASQTGESFSSPELHLRAKDGSDRIATGTMSVLGDDIIVAWTDLTEIRRSEEALHRSEQHFRVMIEKTVMGIYVRRDGRFVYANPRYCEMTGWSRDELIGQEIWKFTTPEPENVQHIRAAWDQLDMGQHSVHYNVPLLCKSGEIRELALHATSIQWDGGPATIVVAEDVTERKQAEQKIADYVKQLEASMRGTLQAVSNMIDRRDPYTAGHERRVGLIAGAIAAEMGWTPERCEMLELIGLVHDIGKIAVPAEILSKPGRLSPVEMELVRGHAQAGYEILKDVPFPFPVAEIIYQHHERLDGSGYPRGLLGEQILPEARILAVADVLESIAAHRPYRPALGQDKALEELERGKGTHYDPDVVQAAYRLIHEKGYVLPQ